MPRIHLKPLPLTAERFAPFGDVIEIAADGARAMNEGRFARFGDLARVEYDAGNDGHVAMSIVKSKSATTLPYHFDMVERHPLGSQAFIPLEKFLFVVVVAPAGEEVSSVDLSAFVTNGSQGINYHRGTWHMPLIAVAPDQEFLVVDRSPADNNLDVIVFDAAVVLEPF